MVKFGEYFESMVALKPEWRKAFIDYPRLNKLLGDIKKSVQIEMHMEDGSVHVVKSVKQFQEAASTGKVVGLSEASGSFAGSNGAGGAREDARQDTFHSDYHNMGSASDDLHTGGGKQTSNSLNADDVADGNSHSKRDSNLRKRGQSTVDNDDDLETLFTRDTSRVYDPLLTTPPMGPLQGSNSLPIAAMPQNESSSSIPIASANDGTPLLNTNQASSANLRAMKMPVPAAGSSVSMNTLNEDTPKSSRHIDQRPGYVSVSRKGSTLLAPPPTSSPQMEAAQTPNSASLPIAAPMDGFLPPEVLPVALSPSNAAGNDGSSARFTGLQGYLPKISELGANAAVEFEGLLESEVKKATKFARNSLETFYKYFDNNKKNWLDKNYSRPRAKDSMRYLHSEVTHLCEFVETNELTIKKSLKKYLHSHPFFIREEISEQYLVPPLKQLGEEAEQLREALAAMWAEMFGEDVTSAKKKIVGRSASPKQSFRAGFLFALIICTGLYWIHVFYELELSQEALTRFNRLYPVSRLFITMAFVYVCWSFSLNQVERHKINYLYVMELSQKASMTWMQCLEYGLLMFWIAILFPILYARSIHERLDCYMTSNGFPGAAPYFQPICIALFVLTILFPIRHVFKRSRSAFFTSFFRCCKQPFGGAPKFQDFFVADWGTSFAYSCQDLLYTVCYYTATPPEEGNFNSPTWDTCQDVRAKWGYPVAMIPYFWRACHTMKMYRKTGQTAHLINHFKYVSMGCAFIAEWWFANSPSPTLHVFVWIFHVGSQIYAYVWDILMDWGWIRGKKRGTLLKSMTPHYIAIVFDLCARMFFIPASLRIQPHIGKNRMYTIQALLEVWRRAVWSIFRLENENLNNLETYRTVDFVPHVVLHDE